MQALFSSLRLAPLIFAIRHPNTFPSIANSIRIDKSAVTSAIPKSDKICQLPFAAAQDG